MDQSGYRTGIRASVIALLEASKAMLAAATGLEVLGPQPLRHGIMVLIRRFSLDPDHGTLLAAA